MNLLLIRHGETALNVARILQPVATPLSERGLAQAAALGQRLKSAGVDAIVSSDLLRALQTAQAIGAACGLPVLTTPLLHERNFGDLRGQRYDALNYDPMSATEAPPNGESAAQFAQRCAQAWVDVLQRQALLRSGSGGRLAVVTHGLVLRAWLQPDRVDMAHCAAPAAWANTSVSVVSAAPPHRVDTLNCTQHLDGLAAHDERSLSGG